MAKERLKSPRARLFVALDLPDTVREGLVAWQARECGDPALRPLPGEALHVTLCFLGWRPERAIAEIEGELAALGPRRVALGFTPEPVAVPPARPRLFAADAPSEAAVELQAELSARLEARRLYEPEQRPFWSHVTLARVRPERGAQGSKGRRRARPRRVERRPGPLSEALLEPFDAVRVALYRSRLRPAGAEYESLAGFELPSA